jgi:hypothetical protein
LITAAVGGALTLGMGLQSAQADHQMLFPYVVKDTNRTTVITMMGWGQPVSSTSKMHLQYWTKSTTDANTAACQPNSSTLSFTDNDIVTFDTAGLLGTGPLFGDTTNSAPLGTSISYAGPRHGYMVVASNNRLFGGYWLELDLANGGAHGDAALGNADNGEDFVSGTENNSALYVGDTLDGAIDPISLEQLVGARAVPFWPTSTASTVFTVTPLGTAMETVENNQVIMQVLNTNNVQGAYDRNENGVDGTVRQTVRCVGRLTAAQLMPGVVANAAWAAVGGWGWLANLGNGNTNFTEGCGTTLDCPAMVYQVDSSNAAGSGKFMQNATRIVTDTEIPFGPNNGP